MSNAYEPPRPDDLSGAPRESGSVQPREGSEAALIETIRNLTHDQLIQRDIEFGLRAEIHRLEYQIMLQRNSVDDAVKEVRQSRTWKVGRTVLLPLAVIKRSVRGVDG